MQSDIKGDSVGSRFRDYIAPFHGMIAYPQDIDVYKNIYSKIGKSFVGLDTFPLGPVMNYEPAEPEYLTWCGMGWDKFRSSDKFKNFITSLSNNLPMKIYGPSNYMQFLPANSYYGFTPPGISHIEEIHQNGMYLVTHADMYIEAGAPTSRIFEALAANAIIISDKHPFVMKYFGNNILYYDQYATNDIMYNQVKSHYDWIKANPEQAKAMAGRAHQIYLENFTIEKDLIRIAKMHEYVMSHDV